MTQLLIIIGHFVFLHIFFLQVEAVTAVLQTVTV